MHTDAGIVLGYPFDQLLNQDCPLANWQGRIPGIQLPTPGSPGTGSIVIVGPPGSGKTTLALQFAAACARRAENRSVPAFLSLEASATELARKARPFGWNELLQPICHLHNVGDFASPPELAQHLENVLTQPSKCPMRREGWESNRRVARSKCPGHGDVAEPQILVPSLSPRPILASRGEGNIFWKRYEQIRKLLAAAQRLRNDAHKEHDKDGGRLTHIKHLLPLVVIDSLNMLGLHMPEREEVLQLFSLFRRFKTIGVFTVETGQPTPFDSTMADIVISLEPSEDQGYALSYLQIVKSRYTPKVHGRHPFKTLDWQGEDIRVPAIRRNPFDVQQPRCGVVVYPSIHYVKQKRQRERRPGPAGKFALGIDGVDSHILPQNLGRRSVVTIEGPRATFKTTFAVNFLFHGLVGEESGLLIRLHETPRLRPGEGGTVPRDLRPRLSRRLVSERAGFKWEQLGCVEDAMDGGPAGRSTGRRARGTGVCAGAAPPRWGHLAGSQKAAITVWRYDKEEPGKTGAFLFEVDFKGGALLPEEMIQTIEDVLIRQEGFSLQRAVLDDVAAIGVSYPLLRSSRTTGELFLPVFVDFLRNSGLDLVITGTTGGVGPADDIVRRACALADTVISCRSCDVFGERYVIVRGEGLVAGRGKPEEHSGESVPCIVELLDVRDEPCFVAQQKYLQGLVGFDGPRIHRPGLCVYVFEENDTIHKLYNDELEVMLRACMASGAEGHGAQRQRSSETAEVAINRFSSDKSEAVHDARAVLRGAPLDRTVLCTVDEFWETAEDIRVGLVEKTPSLYYRNALMLAYRNDVESCLKGHVIEPSRVRGSNGVTSRARSWAQVVRGARQIAKGLRRQADWKEGEGGAKTGEFEVREFWFDVSARETLSCALMDALAAGCRRTKRWETDKGMGGILEQPELTHRQLNELESLCDLFAAVGPIEHRDRSVLPPNAAVYLCWYSQLRELIDRQQDLAERLNVCALPGRGFRGDWYLGIVKGSVSVALGNSIVGMLTKQEEDYKRFARGVGMPASDGFYEKKQNFFSWLRGWHVPISDVYTQIHKKARSRGKITDYLRFRSALWTVAKQLTPLAGPALRNDTKGGRGRTRREIIRTIVGRLLGERGQIALLRRGRRNRK